MKSPEKPEIQTNRTDFISQEKILSDIVANGLSIRPSTISICSDVAKTLTTAQKTVEKAKDWADVLSAAIKLHNRYYKLKKTIGLISQKGEEAIDGTLQYIISKVKKGQQAKESNPHQLYLYLTKIEDFLFSIERLQKNQQTLRQLRNVLKTLEDETNTPQIQSYMQAIGFPEIEKVFEAMQDEKTHLPTRLFGESMGNEVVGAIYDNSIFALLDISQKTKSAFDETIHNSLSKIKKVGLDTVNEYKKLNLHPLVKLGIIGQCNLIKSQKDLDDNCAIILTNTGQTIPQNIASLATAQLFNNFSNTAKATMALREFIDIAAEATSKSAENRAA